MEQGDVHESVQMVRKEYGANECNWLD